MRRAVALFTLALGLIPTLDAARRRPIIYVQAVRYKPSVTKARADELLRSMKQTFRKIPQVRSVRIGRVARSSGPAYEYAVIMEFDSLEDLKSYGQSETHRRWVKEHAADVIDLHLMLTIDTAPLEK